LLVLLFLAIQVIPRALGQRQTLVPKPTLSNGVADSGAAGDKPAPATPLSILYDQYNNAATDVVVNSQEWEAPFFTSYTDELADDFVVPGGQSWSVETIDADGLYFSGPGPAQNLNVRFYTDSAGLPGALVASRIGMSYVQAGTTFTITLSPAVSLTPGIYWVSVQARQDFTPNGEWGWTGRTVQSNQGGAWQNPEGGWGVGCTSWGRKTTCLPVTQTGPDQLFRLLGTTNCANPNTDFNNDGKPDYVLCNASTHQTAVWYMNNNVFLSGVFGPTLPAAWNVIDVTDFNGDGNLDYALFNPSTHQTAIWYLNDNAYTSGAYGPALSGAWALVATGDFNGDCNPDYALYNASTRETAVWYLNNNVYVNAGYGPPLPAGWSVVGLADFNGDGKIDYLLFNSTARQSAIWYLNNNVYASGVYGPTLPKGWELRGTADYNRDGHPDYLLFNPTTRQSAIWYLNNNVYISGAYGPLLPLGWSLIAP
jgi:hypothetical protein